MYSSVKPENAYEIVQVNMPHVHCDGGEGPLGHPRVYLEIDAHQGYIVCPYCSREFRLRA